jgi:hypothetical protein
MVFRLDVNCDNEAFTDDPTAEVARILRGLSQRLEGASPDESFPLRDLNGNGVGSAEFTKD